jgi:hypothetical protein
MSIFRVFAVEPLVRAALRRAEAAVARRDEGSFTFIVMPLVEGCVAYASTVEGEPEEARRNGTSAG